MKVSKLSAGFYIMTNESGRYKVQKLSGNGFTWDISKRIDDRWRHVCLMNGFNKIKTELSKNNI